MGWPAEAVWERVAPLLPGFTVEVLPQLDSTNSELMRRVRAGQADPILLVAESQTSGRGRLGRQWFSAPGDSLTFSLGLPLAPADWSGLSLCAGLAIADALHPDIGLKWPNDLWVGGRKLAGILIETAALPDVHAGRYTIVGVGVNVRTPQAVPTSVPPIGLVELDPMATASSALLAIVPPLVQALIAFEGTGFAAAQPRFAARDVLAGRAVRLADGREGVARGVDRQGALLVHTAAGLETVSSAEVSVRPA